MSQWFWRAAAIVPYPIVAIIALVHFHQLWIVSILVGVACLAVGFLAGLRYAAAKLLPGLLARMTEEELSELASKAAEERRAVEAAA